MDRYRVAATFNGTLSQRPPFQPTAPSSISLPPKPHLREPPTPTTTRRTDDADISIFDAERYYNGGQDPHAPPKKTIILEGITERCDYSTRDSSVSSLDGFARNYKSNGVTPTATSEASWNSQCGLLTNHPGSVAVNVRVSPMRKASSPRRWLFGRNCPCSGKKSVDVKEKYAQPKSPTLIKHDPKRSSRVREANYSNPPQIPIRSDHNGADEEKKIERDLGIGEVMKLKIVAGSWSKDEAEIGRRIVNPRRPFGEGFSFPVLAPGDRQEDPARESLEVFRPPEELPPVRIHYDGDGRAFNVRDDDVASDASSDLFEIESFSAHRKDSLEEQGRFGGCSAARIMQFRRSLAEAEGAATPSIAPSECYPPSEVSVEWSVTTAEGFDRASLANFSSAASEYEELRFMQEEHDRFAAAAVGGGRRRGGGLLTCVSEKAVSVGPNPVRFGVEQRRGLEPDQLCRMGRLGGGNPMHDLSGGSRSHSARMVRAVQTR